MFRGDLVALFMIRPHRVQLVLQSMKCLKYLVPAAGKIFTAQIVDRHVRAKVCKVIFEFLDCIPKLFAEPAYCHTDQWQDGVDEGLNIHDLII